MFDIRCSILDVRCSMFDVRYWMFDVGGRVKGNGFVWQFLGYSMFDVRCSMVGAG